MESDESDESPPPKTTPRKKGYKQKESFVEDNTKANKGKSVKGVYRGPKTKIIRKTFGPIEHTYAEKSMSPLSSETDIEQKSKVLETSPQVL